MKILLCRGSAQKIATDSGKKLQKIISNPKRYNQKFDKHHRNSQNPIKDPKHAAKNTQPLCPQNPYKEPQSGPKDINCKDIEKDLIENDLLKGSQTDKNTQKSNEAENDSFETIAPEEDNRVRKEFDIGQLGQK